MPASSRRDLLRRGGLIAGLSVPVAGCLHPSHASDLFLDNLDSVAQRLHIDITRANGSELTTIDTRLSARGSELREDTFPHEAGTRYRLEIAFESGEAVTGTFHSDDHSLTLEIVSESNVRFLPAVH